MDKPGTLISQQYKLQLQLKRATMVSVRLKGRLKLERVVQITMLYSMGNKFASEIQMWEKSKNCSLSAKNIFLVDIKG